MAKFEVKYLEERVATGRPYTFLVDGVPSMRWFRAATQEEQAAGLPDDYFVQRTIDRLKAGRSAEAFGTAPVVLVGRQEVELSADDGEEKLASAAEALKAVGVPEAEVGKLTAAARLARGTGRGRVVEKPAEGEPEVVTLGSGKQKVREKRPTFRFVLDGVEDPAPYPTKQAARAACAVKAFMTSGKLGLIDAAREQLTAQFPGSEVKVEACPNMHCVRAFVDGVEHSIEWLKAGGRVAGVGRVKSMAPTDSKTDAALREASAK